MSVVVKVSEDERRRKLPLSSYAFPLLPLRVPQRQVCLGGYHDIGVTKLSNSLNFI